MINACAGGVLESEPHCRRPVGDDKMLRATLIESERYIIRSNAPRSKITQRYGRIWKYKEHKLVDKFLYDVESFVSRTPWMKSEGAFPALAPAFGQVLADLGTAVWLRDDSDFLEFIELVHGGRTVRRIQ